MQVDPLNKAYFAYKVWPSHDWDLKHKPEYSSTAFSNGFIYDGKNIRSDVPGNMNYGFTGAGAGFSPNTLLEAAGVVQHSLPKQANRSGKPPISTEMVLLIK